MVNIKLKNVTKHYRNVKAIEDISLEIRDKEYFIILGPTGAGKTTLLKIIAGLLEPDFGEIYFDGKKMNKTSPQQRNLGFMFENYALFPHLNTFENISYSSRVHDRNRENTRSTVEQVLMMAHLTGRNDALPKELSGGMQQRVALCRALMNLEQTRLLILDEPLKALDAGLRMSLRRDLLLMAKSPELQLTVIHVTNDMREAMMVADRIAVIDQGQIVQIGSPHEIYYHPKNLFVANFMSEINYFEGICLKDQSLIYKERENPSHKNKLFEEIHEDSSPLYLDIGSESSFVAYVENGRYSKLTNKEKILLVVRSNHMKIRLGRRNQDKQNSFVGTIVRRKFMGVFYRFEVLININEEKKIAIINIPSTAEIHRKFLEGLEVTIYFPKELGIVFQNPGKKSIKKILKIK